MKNFRSVLTVWFVLAAGGSYLLAAPTVIKDFSSKGGSATNKTGPKDRMYLAKPGDKITFSVKADGADKYEWQVNKKVQAKADGNSLTWTVPSKKSNWDITVVVSSLAGRNRVTWSITTSAIKTVKPGESIQKAIDSLPDEGGIVELADGTFAITSTIRIRKSNITLRGAGMDKTIIKGEPAVPFRADKLDKRPRRPWGVWPKDETFLTNITLEEIQFLGDYKAKKQGGISFCAVKDSKLAKVRVKDHYKGGIYLPWCRFVTINQCELDRSGSITTFYTTDSTITHNRVNRNIGSYGGITLNGGQRMTVSHNFVSNTGMFFGIAVYSAGGSRVFENTVENARFGIWVYDGGGNRIERNTLRSNRGAGIFVTASDGKNKPAHRAKHIFRGNVIYGTKIYRPEKHNEGGHGIWVKRKNRPGHPNPLYVTIESNTIYGSKIDGIRIEHKQHGDIKNNIIVANQGYGINGPGMDITYNNVWGNKGGAYNGCAGGTGAISAGPLFAQPAKSDFHLKSKAGRWNPKQKKWVKDNVTSPCIDAGDPKADCSKEPSPNGKRINMGAYGNAKEASKSTKG